MIKRIEEPAMCKVLDGRGDRMVVRPKTGSVSMFMCPSGIRCSIGVYPQQKWKAEADGNMVLLNYKNITMKISKAYFEETFRVVEE